MPNAKGPAMCEHASQGGGAPPAPPPGCRIETLGVAFFDLSPIPQWTSSDEDARIASFFADFYALAARHIEAAGGRIAKVMGDAGLVTFPRDDAEAVIFALCDLARDARRLAQDAGLDTWLAVNVHVGPVVEGEMGPPGAERYDVVGKTVNVCARLGRRGITLSPQAFRCLSPEGRERFTKITRPIVYQLRD
jgi:class 3 adenylate cyclase